MAKRALPPLVNDPIRLRLLEPGDLPMTRRWRNQDHIRQWFLDSAIITEDRHAAWFSQYRDRDDDFVFVIEETAMLKRPIGQISHYGIDWEQRRAKFGRLLIGDPAAAGQGLARRAVETLLEYADAELGLDELRLEVLANNLAAIAIYERCGFTVVARRDAELHMTRATRRTSQP